MPLPDDFWQPNLPLLSEVKLDPSRKKCWLKSLGLYLKNLPPSDSKAAKCLAISKHHFCHVDEGGLRTTLEPSEADLENHAVNLMGLPTAKINKWYEAIERAEKEAADAST